ncbi:MAG: PEP-CTERM sorting domain-containing protein [Phycisphaerae bacterium]|nr:PEP-CTERM sorting domain-containing protein [Phycisphaerae bacterium]
MRKVLTFVAVAAFATTVYGAAFTMNFTDAGGVVDLGSEVTLAESDSAYIQVWLDLDAGELSAESFYKLLATAPVPTGEDFVWTGMTPGPDVFELNSPNYAAGIESWASDTWSNSGYFPFEGPGSFLLTTLVIHCTGIESITDIGIGGTFPMDYNITPDFTQFVEPNLDEAMVTVIQIPEPASLALLALGGLALIRRR